MRRDTLTQLAALALMLACMAASVFLTTQVSASIGRNRLVYADKAEAGDPPQVALGIAMGAFRGVFVNMLWMRANTLKEEGKHHEAVDLARTITRLQPRFPKVWSFHAWNLAYNISVATQTHQERWQWVNSGIRLLRDQGIPANPSDMVLHKELAWIYLHKVQGIMDDAHRFYKKSLALEWGVLLGKPPALPLGNQETRAVSDLYIQKWLRPIADAPDTLDDLYALHPEGRELVDRLRQARLPLDMTFLAQVERLVAAIRTAQAVGLAPDLSDDPLGSIMAEPRFADAGRTLVLHVRKRMLVDSYHMEPERMIRYTEKFGPLDWRHGGAHALYWAARGVEEGQRRVTKDNRPDFDFVNTDRLVVQAVQDLFRTGLLFADPVNPDFFMALPNPHFLDAYEAYREEATLRGGVFESSTRTRTEFREGLENFYRDAIRYLYRRGDKAKAGRYLEKLRVAPWLNDNNPFKRAELSKPLEEFVVAEILDENRFTSPQVALQEIAGALEAAYFEGLLGNNTPVFTANLDYARKFHAEFQKTQAFRTWVAGEQGRMGFPPFDIYAAQLLSGMIMAAQLPQGPIIYQRAPTNLRALAYVFLEFNGLKASMGGDAPPGATTDTGEPSPSPFDTWFPPPPPDILRASRAQLREFTDKSNPDQGGTELK